MVKEVFEARSFAVIGASREEGKVGNIIFKNLLQNGIKAFPVNPNAQEILGEKCYKSLKEIKEKIDCVIIAIKSEFVLQVLKEVNNKDIKIVVIISSGFSESGNKDIEDKIKELCFRNNIKLIGPNTLGYINPYNNLNASFFATMPNKGKIAFLSQSGAIGSAILDMDIGFSGFVSLGNMACLDFSDFIEYFSNDKNTEVITLYIESLKKDMGKRFIETCKRCKKPIIAIKSGKTPTGIKAASSHTAALASEEGVYEGIFSQCKIIEADSVKQMFLIAELLVKYKNIGKNACVVTNGGGVGVLCSDYCFKLGINLPMLPNNIFKKLDEFLPEGWGKNNPIDILGDAKAELYEKTLDILENEKFFDFYIILLTPQYMTEPDKTAEILLKMSMKKPILSCFMGGNKVESARQVLSKNNILVFDDVKDLCEVLGKVVK